MDSRQAESAFALVEAGIALTSELSLDALLQRARRGGGRADRRPLCGARGPRSRAQGPRALRDDGIDAETHAAIGDLPRGRGILGVLIRDARPLRLHDI